MLLTPEQYKAVVIKKGSYLSGMDKYKKKKKT